MLSDSILNNVRVVQVERACHGLYRKLRLIHHFVDLSEMSTAASDDSQHFYKD